MILDKKLLTKQGYLNFNLKDLNENLFNEFKEHLTQKYLRTKINVLRADSIILEKNLSKIKEIDDKFNVRTEGRDFETEDSSYRKLQNKYHGNLDNLKEVNKYLASMDVTKTCGVGGGGQVWLYGPCRNMIPSKNNLIESLYLQTVVELYKDDIINHDEYQIKKEHSSDPYIGAGTDITLYLKDNYISPHADGIDGTRLCVLLMYLNDDWENGYGGEIVVNNEITIPPLFGNIVILDFTQNNINHEVLNVIKENFERYAIIKFFYK